MENQSDILKLSQLSAIVAEVFQMHFSEERYWVTAEIIGMKLSRGHCYLQLAEKDENGATPKAEFRGNIWSFQYERISQRFFRMTGSPLREHIQVLLCVEVKYHERYGLSLIIHDIDPAFTLGHLELEKRKTIERLKKEGIYERNRELDLPVSLQRIALISAEDSRGYEDFMNRLGMNPYGYAFKVTLYNSLLQGDLAAGNIIAQLQQIKNDLPLQHFDAVALVRGGGGSSGMECFNNYLLSEALATFPLPVITGIGHHADSSVADEVAHTQRMTPTDVANFLIEHQQEFEGTVNGYWEHISEIADIMLNDERDNISSSSTRLASSVRLSVMQARRNMDQSVFSLRHQLQGALIQEKGSIISFSSELKRLSRLETQMEKGSIAESQATLQSLSTKAIQSAENKLTHSENCIRLLDPDMVLKRGYSYTLLNGRSIQDAAAVKTGDAITTVLLNGSIESTVN